MGTELKALIRPHWAGLSVNSLYLHMVKCRFSLQGSILADTQTNGNNPMATVRLYIVALPSMQRHDVNATLYKCHVPARKLYIEDIYSFAVNTINIVIE